MKNFFKASSEESSFLKSVPAVIWQALFFYVPVFLIIFLSFFKNYQPSLYHYQQLFDLAFFKIIFRSLILATTTTIMCLLVGYPIAYFIAIKKRTWKNVYLFFLVIPFFTNFLVLTYAWYFILDYDGLLNSMLLGLGIIQQPLRILNTNLAIFLVMFYAYLPFMIVPLFTILEKFDMTLIEASRDLGATATQTFFRVIFPLSLPAIKVGVLLVFVPAFGEFVIPLLVGGGKDMYVGSVISHYFFIGQNAYAGAAFTVMASIVLFSIMTFIIFCMKSKTAYETEGGAQ